MPNRFNCDAPGCQSFCELSATNDLASPGRNRAALIARGWVTRWNTGDDKHRHYCPGHVTHEPVKPTEPTDELGRLEIE